VKVSTVQMRRHRKGKEVALEGNVNEACVKLDMAGRQRADIVLLPEMATIYGMQREKALKTAQTLSDWIAGRYIQKAKQYEMYIIGWLIEKEDGKLYNTSFIIDRSGNIIGKYRKTHLTLMEREDWRITPGDEYPVFKTDFGTIGIMICFDNHFPEVPRILALKGAEIIFYPLAGEEQEELIWEVMLRSRAIDNRVHIVSSQVYYGARSCIVDNEGYIIADAGHKHGVVSAEIDLDREGRLCYTVKDEAHPLHRKLLYWKCRRPETYQELLKRVEIDISEVLADDHTEFE